jgi:hypothetical protein
MVMPFLHHVPDFAIARYRAKQRKKCASLIARAQW